MKNKIINRQRASRVLDYISEVATSAKDFLIERPIRNLTSLGLAGLVAVTALKDNVHFGSLTLYNPKESHYVWGALPFVGIEGQDTCGDIYNLGIVSLTEVRSVSNHKGNLNSYGLIGGLRVGDGCKIKGNISSYEGLVSVNGFGDNVRVEGNISAYGLVMGVNDFKNNTRIKGDMNAYGIGVGVNNIGDSTKVSNDSRAEGNVNQGAILFGGGAFKSGTKITGDVSSTGLVVKNIDGFSLGRKVHIGLEDYIIPAPADSTN